MMYSREADRLYCMSERYWGGMSAVQSSDHKLCWSIMFDDFDNLRDICTDTVRGKLYCSSWPMGVSVVDLSKRKVTANLSPESAEDEPVAGCVNALLDRSYILMEDGGIMVFDAVADTVVASLSLDSTLKWNLIACAAQAGRVLCAAKDSEFGLLIDCATDSVVGKVRWRNSASVVEAGPDGSTFLVATRSNLHVIDAASGAVLKWYDIGSEPIAVCCAADLHKFYCADRGGRLYVASTLSDSLVGFVDFDGYPTGLCYDSVDSKLYVTTTICSSTVWVVDCTSDTVTACIKLAGSGEPSRMVYSTLGNRVYFVSGDSLGVIECDRDTVVVWIPHRWYNPGPPHVIPALRLVSVTDRSGFITIFEDPPARPVVTAAGPGREPTVAKGVLRVTGGRTGRLFDLSGRNVLDLLPGWNDVSGLPPGIYFSREQKADGGGPVRTRKVVILP
jgi:hypothetical protein